VKENWHVTHRMTLQNCKKHFPCFDMKGYFQMYVITCCAEVQGFLLAVLCFDYRWLHMEYIVWQCNVRELVCPHHIGVSTAHFVVSTIHISMCP
jgi:hypothetical protein